MKDDLSSIKRSLIALKQLKEKLEILEQSKKEPIAIIGMGCRFPGQANNPEAFYNLLKEGRDGITEVPRQHWDNEIYYDSDPTSLGKIYSPYGGFVPHLDTFDANFFRIAPREAVSLDPQQRLLLEVSWEALEYGGIAAEQLVGSQTGVFIGICGNDYWHELLMRNPKEIDAYMTTGNNHSLASGRLSYTLGLTGPSLSINTACSSSLVAVHLAIASLRNQECDLAIVGGVNRIFSPKISINFSKAKMLSPDGHCKTFDESANGFVRAEGCGVVILKRLKDAAKDNILALLCGSATNQDGRTTGLTVPNGRSQQAVIEQALQNSQIEAEQINYIETHGTGTVLGDPIEVKALGHVFGSKCHRPLVLGSVKANIGHTEAAAGIASLIKVVLSLQYETIPPQIHFKRPNPNINWQDLPFIIPSQPLPYPRGETPRIAGVSSFGFSGTNAHVIVAEAPPSNKEEERVEPKFHLFTLSAKNETAQKLLAQHYYSYLISHPNLSVGDICYTANIGRSHFNHRLAIVTSSISQLKEQLTCFSGQERGIYQNNLQGNLTPKLVFLFGQENQQAMDTAHYLYQSQAIFKEAIDLCSSILSVSVADLFAQSSPVLSFSLKYALFAIWQSWGVKPTAMIGSGIGEYVAAIVAGVFTLEEGLQLTSSGPEAKDFPSCLPKIPLLNPMTGEMTGSEIITSKYWLSQKKYAKQKDILKQKGYDLILEIDSLTVKPDDCWQLLLSNLAQLYVQGVSINWSGFYANYSYKKVILPTYPFQRSRYWVEKT